MSCKNGYANIVGGLLNTSIWEIGNIVERSVGLRTSILNTWVTEDTLKGQRYVNNAVLRLLRLIPRKYSAQSNATLLIKIVGEKLPSWIKENVEYATRCLSQCKKEALVKNTALLFAVENLITKKTKRVNTSGALSTESNINGMGTGGVLYNGINLLANYATCTFTFLSGQKREGLLSITKMVAGRLKTRITIWKICLRCVNNVTESFTLSIWFKLIKNISLKGIFSNCSTSNKSKSQSKKSQIQKLNLRLSDLTDSLVFISRRR